MAKEEIDNRREHGVIISAEMVATLENGIETAYVYVKYNSYSQQGFGSLYLKDDLAKAWTKELCYTFNVKSIKDLKNEEIYILKSLGDFNEDIEGIESIKTGLRFTITGFQRKYGKLKVNKLDKLKQQLKNDILWAEKRIKETEKELETIDSRFVDWEKQ